MSMSSGGTGVNRVGEYSKAQHMKILGLLFPTPGDSRYRHYIDRLRLNQHANIPLSEHAPNELKNDWLKLGLPVKIIEKTADGLIVEFESLLWPSTEFQDRYRSIPGFPRIALNHNMIRIDSLNRFHGGGMKPGKFSISPLGTVSLKFIARPSGGIVDQFERICGAYDFVEVFSTRPNGEVVFFEESPLSTLIYQWRLDPSRVGDILEAALIENLELDNVSINTIAMIALGKSIYSEIPRLLDELNFDTFLEVLERDLFRCADCKYEPADSEIIPLMILQRYRTARRKNLLAEDLQLLCDRCSSDLAEARRQKQLDQKRIPARMRWDVLVRDDFTCQYCGRKREEFPDLALEADHVIAWSKGGRTNLDNLVTSCHDCNSGKSDRDLPRYSVSHES